MLNLYVFGSYFDLPDASPFCIKALTLLKMSGLPFETRQMNFKQAPKGKAPYLGDGALLIGDSHFIQRHLETVHGVDFSGGYQGRELAVGWAIARMMEEHFYFIEGSIRWRRDGNFWKGPYQFFQDAPKPLRPLIARLARRHVVKSQNLQGMGRHTDAERFELSRTDLASVEAMLERNSFVLGDRPCGVDAAVFGQLWASSTPFFDSELGDYIRSRPLLTAYLARMKELYFPDYAERETGGSVVPLNRKAA